MDSSFTNSGNKMKRVYLTERNLKSLRAKLDVVLEGEMSWCTIVKRDNVHPEYPQTDPEFTITAVETSPPSFEPGVHLFLTRSVITVMLAALETEITAEFFDVASDVRMTAIRDSEYYTHRAPGPMMHL